MHVEVSYGTVAILGILGLWDRSSGSYSGSYITLHSFHDANRPVGPVEPTNVGLNFARCGRDFIGSSIGTIQGLYGVYITVWYTYGYICV